MTEVAINQQTKIKEKLWVWRPILFFAVIGFIIFVFVSNSFYTDNQLDILRAKQPITKVEMKIGSDSPVTYVTILDRIQLDSINLAFQTAQEKEIQKGGAFQTWANVNVYKGNKKANLLIQHSIYNGWMIEVGSKTLTSDYLFGLVRRYSRQN